MPCGPAGFLLMLGLGRVLGSSLLPAADEPAPAHAPTRASFEGHPVVLDWEDAVRDQPGIELLARSRWVRHRIRPRERVTQIAARYRVLLEDLVEWNDLDPSQELPPRGRRSLRVRTAWSVPPRFKAFYLPEEGEGWGDVAAKFRIEQPDLRAFNWRQRRPTPGRHLLLWVDPGIPRTIRPGQGPLPEPAEVPAGGISVGRPHHGRLVGGVQLPESPLYTRGYPGGLFGSTHTIEVLLEALGKFRHDTGYEGEVVIGAMSRRRGRAFSPHVSHQSGRDIDIRLPLWPGIEPHSEPNADEIDWYATWGLVRAFVETDEVSIIFLDVSLQRRLYEAARAMGETHDSLREVITWPSWKNKKEPLVRHFPGHDGHLHVRIDCDDATREPKCR